MAFSSPRSLLYLLIFLPYWKFFFVLNDSQFVALYVDTFFFWFVLTSGENYHANMIVTNVVVFTC